MQFICLFLIYRRRCIQLMVINFKNEHIKIFNTYILQNINIKR